MNTLIHRKLFIGITFLIVVGLVAVGAYKLGGRQTAQNIPSGLGSSTPEVPAVAVPEVTQPEQTTPPTQAETEIVWLSSMQKIANLTILNQQNDPGDPLEISYQYYKVGTDNGNDIILALRNVAAMGGGTNKLLFRQTGTNTYELLANHSDKIIYVDADGSYTWPKIENAPLNTTLLYKSIEEPALITVSGTKLKRVESRFESPVFDEVMSPSNRRDNEIKQIAVLPQGTLYEKSLSYNKDAVYKHFTYFLQLRNGLVAYYAPTFDFINSDYVPQITWNDGTKNTESFRIDGAGGCGSTLYTAALLENSPQDFVQVGTTRTGEAIYSFQNPNNSVVRWFIEQTYVPKGSSRMTPEEYIAYHALVFYKTGIGKIIVLSNNAYGPAAECGKPVIYLYPTQATPVSVRVDAEITKSEPEYKNGWNVIASPSGSLQLADGRRYDSLFWEGTGNEYPPIDGRGVVVKRGDIESVLKQQLIQLGLNTKESADFLEFWLTKMPSTPYVRLTWFGTEEMNVLAPLSITPAPQTLIRVFLDFEGLNTPITLTPQTLTSKVRKGFTVVEWGGLLRK